MILIRDVLVEWLKKNLEYGGLVREWGGKKVVIVIID